VEGEAKKAPHLQHFEQGAGFNAPQQVGVICHVIVIELDKNPTLILCYSLFNIFTYKICVFYTHYTHYTISTIYHIYHT
jgi:hypothetical protein